MRLHLKSAYKTCLRVKKSPRHQPPYWNPPSRSAVILKTAPEICHHIRILPCPPPFPNYCNILLLTNCVEYCLLQICCIQSTAAVTVCYWEFFVDLTLVAAAGLTAKIMRTPTDVFIEFALIFLYHQWLVPVHPSLCLTVQTLMRMIHLKYSLVPGIYHSYWLCQQIWWMQVFHKATK